MKVSIIIVNYNGKSFLGACVKSIEAHASFDHEIIVVDNASVDGSVEFLRENFPSVRVVESASNLGFTKGNNLGAGYASGEYVLLLNNDTEILGSLTPLVKMLEENARIGALGCRLVYEDGAQQESAGYVPSPYSLLCSWTPFTFLFKYGRACRRTIPADSIIYTQPYVQVGWVSGAFLLTRADLWNELGGLDERYFMYMEDTDYCRRVSECNYTVVYSAATEVRHFEGGGRPWVGERALKNTADSYLIYVSKFYGSSAAFFFRLCLAPIFFLRGIGFYALSLFRQDKTKRDQAKAYARVALSLLLKRVKCSNAGARG